MFQKGLEFKTFAVPLPPLYFLPFARTVHIQSQLGLEQNVTNFSTRGPTGGKTSKEDNVLMWNRVHPPPLPRRLYSWRFESRDKAGECL